MASHQDLSGLGGAETPSHFVGASTAQGLWSMGLKTGLPTQQLAPLNTGTHHKLEVNPFEASYAYVDGERRRLSGVAAPEQLRRPRIDHLQNAGAGPQKDSSSSSDSRSSTESRAMSGYDTPPSEGPFSPVAVKSGASMLSLDGVSHMDTRNSALSDAGGAIDASAYAEHFARYVQAQAVHATRTSAPLAGQSTSRPPVAGLVSSPEMTQMPSLLSDDAMSAGSPEDEVEADDHFVSADVPPAIATVQLSAAQPPRKKAGLAKPTLAGKARKGPGRPRAIKDTEEDQEELTPEETKRRDFLERNRQAACKSRQKRKAWQANLEAESHRLTESNGQLQSLVATLREEIASLRATVAGHAANGCQAARLALQASRPGEVPMAAFVVPSPTMVMHSPSMGVQGAGGDIYVGHSVSALENVMAYQHPSAIEAQRSRSGHGPSPESSSTYHLGAGATYFDVATTAGLSNHALAGRPGDVDLSAYLA